MVSAFTPDNISAFGPLAMMAVMYQLLGLMGGLVIRELFYVPHDFRWGVLVLGIISNWGGCNSQAERCIRSSDVRKFAHRRRPDHGQGTTVRPCHGR